MSQYTTGSFHLPQQLSQAEIDNLSSSYRFYHLTTWQFAPWSLTHHRNWERRIVPFHQPVEDIITCIGRPRLVLIIMDDLVSTPSIHEFTSTERWMLRGQIWGNRPLPFVDSPMSTWNRYTVNHTPAVPVLTIGRSYRRQHNQLALPFFLPVSTSRDPIMQRSRRSGIDIHVNLPFSMPASRITRDVDISGYYNGSAPNAGECTICLGAYAAGAPVYRLPCGHTFHAACSDCLGGGTVDDWFRAHNTCPLCRRQFDFLLCCISICPILSAKMISLYLAVGLEK